MIDSDPDDSLAMRTAMSGTIIPGGGGDLEPMVDSDDDGFLSIPIERTSPTEPIGGVHSGEPHPTPRIPHEQQGGGGGYGPLNMSNPDPNSSRQSWGEWLGNGIVTTANTLMLGMTSVVRLAVNRGSLNNPTLDTPPATIRSGEPIIPSTPALSQHPRNPSDPFGSEPSDDVQDKITLDLKVAIQQYLTCESHATLSIVTAALENRPFDNLLTYADWEEANGNLRLLCAFLESGKLDMNDAKIKESIQHILDQVIPHEKRKYVIPNKHLPIVKALLSTQCARINRNQLYVMSRSGVQFQQIVEDYPHVTSSLPPPAWFSEDMFFLMKKVLAPLWLVIGILSFTTSVVASVALAFEQREKGYSDIFSITLVFIAASNAFAFLLIRILHRRQLKQIRTYDIHMIDFPSVYLKMFPCLFEIALALVGLKHTVIHRGKNVAMTHDLLAMFTMCYLIHSVVYAPPVLLIQMYLINWSRKTTLEFGTYFDAVVITCLICIGCSFPLYVGSVVFSQNTTFFGFAVTSAETQTSTNRASKFTRILALILLYFLVYNMFLLVIGVINISNCSTGLVIWLVSGGAVTVVTVVLFAVSVWRGGDVFNAARWFGLPLIMQFIWFIVGQFTTTGGDNECKLFYSIGIVTVVFNYVGWAIIFALAICFGLYKLVAHCRSRIQETQGDTAGEGNENTNRENESRETSAQESTAVTSEGSSVETDDSGETVDLSRKD